MNMDIAAVVVSVRVGADKGLVSGEMLGTKFLAQCLRPVYGQAVVRCVPWVKGNDHSGGFSHLPVFGFTVSEICPHTATAKSSSPQFSVAIR